MDIKTIASIITLIVIAVLAFLAFRMFRNPKDTLATFVFNWRYRALMEFRVRYIDGKKRNPATSFEFWYNEVVKNLETSNRAKRPYNERQELCDMLHREEYVNYYFQEGKKFCGEEYHAMWDDFRSGQYLTREYDSDKVLKSNLPVEISSNPEAFSDFKKFVDVGWFDSRTGKPTEKIQKQEAGRAIRKICDRHNIKNPPKVFSQCWSEKESTIKEWCRIHKINDAITDQIDDQVAAILEK